MTIASIGPTPDRVDDEEDLTDHEEVNRVTSGEDGGLEPEGRDELEGDEPDPVTVEQGPVPPE